MEKGCKINVNQTAYPASVSIPLKRQLWSWYPWDIFWYHSILSTSIENIWPYFMMTFMFSFWHNSYCDSRMLCSVKGRLMLNTGSNTSACDLPYFHLLYLHFSTLSRTSEYSYKMILLLTLKLTSARWFMWYNIAKKQINISENGCQVIQRRKFLSYNGLPSGRKE